MKEEALAITSFFPLPADRGDPVRVAMFLQALNRVTRLTVCAVLRPTTTGDEVQDLKDLLPGAVVHTFPAPEVRSGFAAKARRWARSCWQSVPPWIANRRSEELHGFLRSTSSGFRIAVLLGEAAGLYASSVPAELIHWDKSNVLSESTRVEAARAGKALKRARLKVIALISARYERRVLALVHSVSVTSAEEARRLEHRLQRKAEAVIPTAVRPFPVRPHYDPRATSVLWLGSFDYGPNRAGLEAFLEEGLPILRESGLVLRVVGSGDSGELAARLEANPGIDFRGFVPALEDAAEGVRAAVVPLWTGAGVKVKTLTALNLGIPVAGTAVALEGISSSAALRACDTSSGLARSIVQAKDEDLFHARDRGLAELERRFSQSRFDDNVCDLVGRLTTENGDL